MMKKGLILGILIAASVFTLISCGKKNTSTSGTNVTVGDSDSIKNYEEKNDKTDDENTNKEEYENVTFDDFIYSDYTGQNEKSGNIAAYLNYNLSSKYDGGYTEKERLELKNIGENISQSLFYGDTYKDKDKTLEYVLSFVDDDTLKENVKVIFQGKFCELIGATYTDDKVKYNTDEIWAGEGHKEDLPYICTEWSIKYYRYDKYDVKQDQGTNTFDLTFIKKDNKWILTKIQSK